MARYSKLGYVALNVSDLERSTDFYQKMVGLQLVGAGTGGQVFFRCSDAHHDLVLYRGKPGLKRIGWQMESWDEVERMRDRLSGAGVKIVEVSESECRQLHLDAALRLTEPHSGVTFEYYSSMSEFTEVPFAPTVAQIARLGHVVIRTPAFEAAAENALGTFNFRRSDVIDGAVHFLRSFPVPFHHSLAFSCGESNGLHHVNFMVTEIDDIGKAITRMRRNGVDIVNGPGRHPPSNSVFLYFLDPDGMTIEYSFGMETFAETDAREARTLKPVPESFDSWGNIPDPRMGNGGVIERLDAEGEFAS